MHELNITINKVVTQPDVHCANVTLVSTVIQALWRLISNKGDTGGGWVLIPIARLVCKMREDERVEGAIHWRVEGLEWDDIIAVVVIPSSRNEWKEMYAHIGR